MRFLKFGLLLLCSHCLKTSPPINEASKVQPDEIWIDTSYLEHTGIRTEILKKRDLRVAWVTYGRVTFDDLKVTPIYSPVTGKVLQIHAKLGDKIQKNTPLALLESPDIGQMSSDLASAQANYVATKRNDERQKVLLDNHAAAQIDYETVHQTFLRAEAELIRAKKNIDMLQHLGSQQQSVSQHYTLYSHVTGEVVARSIHPGDEVQGQYTSTNPAAPLFVIGKTDTVWVLANVYEMDVSRIHQGQHVSVTTTAYPQEIFHGTIDWVASHIDVNTRAMAVRCVIDNADGKLRPEMFVRVTIDALSPEILAVPRQAVYYLDDKNYVFLQTSMSQHNKKQFVRREVTLGDTMENNDVAIIQGLSENDQVVTQGGILLTEFNPSIH